MADSWVVRLLYSLKVSIWGKAPFSFRVNTGFSQIVGSIPPRPPLIRADFSLFLTSHWGLIPSVPLFSFACEARL